MASCKWTMRTGVANATAAAPVAAARARRHLWRRCNASRPANRSPGGWAWRLGFARRCRSAWTPHHLIPGTAVASDGLSCFTDVADADCAYTAIPTGGGAPDQKHPIFGWVISSVAYPALATSRMRFMAPTVRCARGQLRMSSLPKTLSRDKVFDSGSTDIRACRGFRERSRYSGCAGRLIAAAVNSSPVGIDNIRLEGTRGELKWND